MDTLGALALATEPPTNHLMERPPVGRREPLIINIMWRNLIIMALFQVSFLLTLNFKGISLLQLKNDDPAHADKVKNTFIFNTFVFCQVFNEFNSCKPDELNVFKGISENHLFIGIIAITVVLQFGPLSHHPSNHGRGTQSKRQKNYRGRAGHSLQLNLRFLFPCLEEVMIIVRSRLNVEHS
uniref:Cation-transporting P-type ATPase C-terminal domain-containing protein n=1 Tax=Zea mays TaxID=4577 RepID=A0A804M077_MAIZE